jgi:hypothetical protein
VSHISRTKFNVREDDQRSSGGRRGKRVCPAWAFVRRDYTQD